MRAGRVNLAEQRQIRLSADEHEKVRQEVAAAGQAQRLLAAQGDQGVVAVGVLQKHVLERAPPLPAVDGESAEVIGAVRAHGAQPDLRLLSKIYPTGSHPFEYTN